MTEERVKIAAKLYKCRDTAKTLSKLNNESYAEMLKPYTDIIKAVMRSNNLSELEALLRISKSKTYEDSGMAQLLFMAATVELIEPSKA